MLYTVKLFAILAIVGGAIAWLGDVVGARLGKKRSSLFGLRPRQTARLVAVVIGAALPLGGLLVATVTSEYAHKAVFEMEQLVASVEDLKQQVTDYRDEVGQARQAAAKAKEEAARSDELLAEKKDEVANLTDVQTSLTAQVTSLEGEVAASEQAVTTAREGLEQARSKLADADTELADAADHLQVLTDRAQLSEGQLDRAEQRLASAREAQKQATLEVAAKISRLQTLQSDLDDMQRQVENLKERNRLITSRPAIFEPGDELMRVTMDADGTQDQMESKLFELLFFAGAVAERRGVPTGTNGRAVIVVAPTPSPVESGETVPEAAIVRYVASELRTRGPEQWVVMVRTFRRLFAEDKAQLEVQIKATPNERVFEKGEVLAAIGIRAEAGTPEIFTTIYGTITDREKSPVRIMAMARRMLPDPVTGNYGKVHLNEIFDAAAEVQKRQGIVPVRVVAQRDTYTVGPLLINLQVGEGSP